MLGARIERCLEQQGVFHVAGFRDVAHRRLQGQSSGASIMIVTALPAEPPHEDALDPERILRALPERERTTFLAQYHRAVDAAHDPASWKELQRFLRLWAIRAIALTEPAYYEARDSARGGTGGGMLLDDAIRQHRAIR